MRLREILTVMFVLTLFAPLGLSFADDFQGYNSISDASFTSNYTINGVVGGQIVVAPNDSLTLNLTSANIFINITKLNVSYPFTVSYTLRAQSSYSQNRGIYFYLNSSDINYNISELRGYQIDISGTTLNLNRFNPSSSVTLNTSTIPAIDSSKDNIFIIYVDNNKRIHFYINSVEYMSYYDTAETYLSGGIGIYAGTVGTPSGSFYLDNLNNNAFSGSTGGANDWEIRGFTSNIVNLPTGWIGYGSTYNTFQLATTNVTFTTNLQNVKNTYGINLNYDEIKAYFYYLGQPYTEQIRAGSVHILPYMRVKADTPNCYYYNSWNPAQHNYVAIPTIDNYYWWSAGDFDHLNTGEYIVTSMNGLGCTTPSNVTISYDFYNTQTSTYLYTKNVILPIGYQTIINGTTFTVDYNVPIDCNLNASYCPNTPPINLNNTPSNLPNANPFETLTTRLFQPDIIMLFVGLAIAGYLAIIGGTLIGGLGFVTWLIVMLAVGQIPLWIGFLLIVISSLGIAFIIKAGGD